MQYSALWSPGGEFIVQVGMEPINVMRATKKNELSHIFSLLKVNVGVNFYAIDIGSGTVVGTTNTPDLGKNLSEIGLDFVKVRTDTNGFHATINGVNSFCVFKEHGTNLIGRIIANDTLYERIPATVAGLSISVMLLVTVLVTAVSGYVNHYVVGGISDINKTLRSIGNGNLQERVHEQNSLEFAELSAHINEMLQSIMDNNKKMSYILSKTNLYMGIFEYNKHMSKVRYTEYLPRILQVDVAKMDELAADYKRFLEFITSIKEHPFPGEEGIYIIGDREERYVRLEEIYENDRIFGALIDVSDEVGKRRKIESERDLDALTGLYNRRGIDRKIEALFKNPQTLKYGALIMMDADGLKEINDKFGHEKGDLYLKEIANVITTAGFEHFIAARQGGDEYVLFLYNYSSEQNLLHSLEKLRYLQTHSCVKLDEEVIVPLRFSFGYAMIQGRSDYLNILKEADEKMYEDKRHRKTQIL